MGKTIATGLETPQPFPSLPENVMDMFSLKGKVASVTGASGGIGYEVAVAFAQAGANVAMWYNSHSIVEEAEKLSEKYGVTVKAYKCSLTDTKAVEKTVQQIKNDFGGRIDIMVANAGIAWDKGPLTELAEKDSELCDSEWNKVLSIDINGVYNAAKSIGPIFKKQGSGSFVATASMSAHIANVPQLQVAYNAAKAAVIHMCKSLAVEWAGYARANTVSPGYVATPLTAEVDGELQEKWNALTPMGRVGLAKEMVGAYLYLASDASTYTTGSDILVDGGYCSI